MLKMLLIMGSKFYWQSVQKIEGLIHYVLDQFFIHSMNWKRFLRSRFLFFSIKNLLSRAHCYRWQLLRRILLCAFLKICLRSGSAMSFFCYISGNKWNDIAIFQIATLQYHATSCYTTLFDNSSINQIYVFVVSYFRKYLISHSDYL